MERLPSLAADNEDIDIAVSVDPELSRFLLPTAFVAAWECTDPEAEAEALPINISKLGSCCDWTAAIVVNPCLLLVLLLDSEDCAVELIILVLRIKLKCAELPTSSVPVGRPF